MADNEYNGTGAADVITVRRIKEILDNMIDRIYPIGSIYISVDDTNPSELFGGSWQQIKGRFLLGMGFAGTNNSSDHFGQTTNLISWESEKPGETGGEAWHYNTVDEMAIHNHYTNSYGLGYVPKGQATGVDQYVTLVVDKTQNYPGTNATGAPYTSVTRNGNGQMVNNMPPYFSVYMWQRVS